MLIPIEKQEFDYYRAMLQKTHEVRKLINDKKIPLQKKLARIKRIIISDKGVNSSLVCPSPGHGDK